MHQLCLPSAVKHGRNFTLHDQFPSVQQAVGCCVWTSFTFVATEVVQVDRVHYAMLAALFFNGRHAMGRLLAWLYNAERLDAGKT